MSVLEVHTAKKNVTAKGQPAMGLSRRRVVRAFPLFCPKVKEERLPCRQRRQDLTVPNTDTHTQGKGVLHTGSRCPKISPNSVWLVLSISVLHMKTPRPGGLPNSHIAFKQKNDTPVRVSAHPSAWCGTLPGMSFGQSI